MDELIALIRDSDRPAGPLLAFMQEPALKFRRSLIGRPAGRRSVGQIDAFLVPYELILGPEMEKVAGHGTRQWMDAAHTATPPVRAHSHRSTQTGILDRHPLDPEAAPHSRGSRSADVRLGTERSRPAPDRCPPLCRERALFSTFASSSPGPVRHGRDRRTQQAAGERSPPGACGRPSFRHAPGLQKERANATVLRYGRPSVPRGPP